MHVDQLFENERLELKRQLPSSRKLAIEIIALANTRGGRIVVGFDDKAKKITGITPSQKTEERIANIIHDYCEPRITYSISYESLEGGHVLIIDVPDSGYKPHFLKAKGLVEGTYTRMGSTSRLADQETLARLIREGKNISYDSEQTSESVILDHDRIRKYLRERQSRLGAKVGRITPALLEDLHITKDRVPTVTGALLFSDHPQAQAELENAYIKAARFKGEKKGLFIDQRDIAGPLPEQIDDAVGFVLKNIRLRGFIAGPRRVERYEYPPEIIREAVVNAVIHRDYSIRGTCILLAVFDNRIEIASPGGLPGHVTVENISERQYNRNPIIAKRMFDMAYFDSWGQGIDKLLEWAKNHAAVQPVFLDSIDQFVLTLYPEESSQSKTDARDPLLTLVEEKIVMLAIKQGQITNRGLQAALDLSKTQAQVALKRLRERGLLAVHGAGRGTYYTPGEETLE